MRLDVRNQDLQVIQRKWFVCALALASALALGVPQPAAAVDVSIGGISGSIGVEHGFGACANLTFTGGIVTGEFTAFASPVPTGVVLSTDPLQGDNADVPVVSAPIVLDVVPFVATGSTWSHCFSGDLAYGAGVYSLVATGPGGDFAQVLQCKRLSSTMSCT